MPAPAARMEKGNFCWEVFRAHIEWFLLGGGEMLPTFLTFLALLLLQNFSQESNGGTLRGWYA